MFWRGCQRRRGVWARRSWLRFGALLGAAVFVFGIAMAMAYGVDRGVYSGMSPAVRQLYFYTLMTLTILSPLAAVGLLVWFARGRPERQL
jgi:hypothetical protein